MKVIFGLGNPGADYAHTRHNTGWRLVEAYARARGVDFVLKTKFHAYVGEFTLNGDKHLLVRPTTYYNEVGKSARAIADFYKINAADFLIAHDDLALPLGTLRTRIGGSDAGNNGIKSLNAHLGQGTARLRVGISNPDLPPDAIASVLGRLNRSEEVALDNLSSEAFAVFDRFLAGEFTTTTHRA